MFDLAHNTFVAHAVPTPISATLGSISTFAPGQEIYAEGESSGSLYQVTFGVVRNYRLLTDGRRQICAFYMPGDIFGFETSALHHLFADAVGIVGLKILRSANRADGAQEVLGLALKSLCRAHDHMLTLGRNDACGRVAAFLVDIAQRQGSRNVDSINLPMSRLDIADYLGLTIETVSRVFTKFRSQRIISLTSTRHLEVLRWDALETLMA